MDGSYLPSAVQQVYEGQQEKVSNAIEVTPLLQTLLNEAPLILCPNFALEFGVKPALFIAQVIYWLGNTKRRHQGQPVVRFSYSRWRDQFPFVTRYTIINIVHRLEQHGAIQVFRTKRVNLIAIGNLKCKEPEEGISDDKYDARLVVFGSLAKAIGLGPAVCLQQVHIRCHGREPTYFALKSYEKWHNDCLMFWSVRQIKRYFEALMNLELVIVKKFRGHGGLTNGYRVDYQKLESLMSGKTTLAPVVDWELSPKVAKEAVSHGEFFGNHVSKGKKVKILYSKYPIGDA